jgi:outer membrane protein insertion porin family
MKRAFAAIAVFACLAVTVGIAATPEPLPMPPVVDIRIVPGGSLAVDRSYVLAHVAVTKGEPYNRVAVGRDVTTLLKTSRFSDVTALVEEVPGGVALTYRVTPKPKIGQPVAVTGTKAIRVSKILSELNLQPGDWVDEPLLGQRAKKVEELYRKEGYASAAVTGTLTLTDTNAGLCTVSFEVREGEPARLRSVEFNGNEAVSDGTLRTLLNLPAWWNPWYYFRKPNYDAADMNFRREDVRNQYRDLGYLDAKIGPLMTTSAGYGRLRLSMTVEEGVLYHVGTVDIRGVKLFPLEEVSKACVLKTGDVAAMTAIRASAKAVRDFYGSRGYIHTLVDPVFTPAGPGVMDVRFEVREGRLTYVGAVVIRGNEVTREKVIRREVNVYPGEIYNEVKTAQTEKRLMGLNYFENVVSYPVATAAPGTNDLVIEVLEKPTGLFTVGAGFSSVDSLMGYMEISQGNFDLFGWPSFTGGGQRLKLGLKAGTTMSEYNLSLTEPWFLDRPLSLTVEGYIMSRNYDEYDVTRTGGSTALGFPVPFSSRLEIRYRLERIVISDVEDEFYYTDVDGSTFYFTEEEARTDSSISALLSRDKRDSVFVPTRGNRVSLSAVLTGGPMGFDTDMYELTLKGEQHYPLWFKHVLSLRGSADVMDSYGRTDEVPISERLYCGGPRTVRGFKYRDVGPKAYREVTTDNGTTYIEYQPRGGQTLLLASAEYAIPLGVPNIRLAAFFDAGSLAVDPYDFSCQELAWGTGLGFRLDIPGFPVRLDYAFKTDVHTDRDKDETRTERWSFWIGYGF